MSGTTVIRAAALVAMTALAAGCQSTGTDEAAAPAGSSTPAAPSADPEAAPAVTTSPVSSPSPATAANTVAVCSTVDKLIITKSKEIAAGSASATRRELTPEQINAEVKSDLADLADDVRGQAARATDPEIKALITATAKQIDAGADSATPVKWLSSTFVGIPQRLSEQCRV
ncbi:hypothetical protein MRQ36_15660 [Micromonospora sp. R77]|uniref:hypothetical protein n=1 Tax=Micromonospora sp. R77 TaxID=2925836 RepID=UPI001F60537F|nr:hypothetical protein [Micromonospora sp. R77]MCI4063947.1 hypothetical protein [Micromonospora sp. R77]